MPPPLASNSGFHRSLLAWRTLFIFRLFGAPGRTKRRAAAHAAHPAAMLAMLYVAATGALGERVLGVLTFDVTTVLALFLDVTAAAEAIRLRGLFLGLGRAFGVVLVFRATGLPTIGTVLALAPLLVSHGDSSFTRPDPSLRGWPNHHAGIAQ